MLEGKLIPHKMLSLDAFSTWLGIEILESEVGRCRVAMTVREEMLNSMGNAHGGISYSLADTAFGFAANSHGLMAVSIETSINHIDEIKAGDYLVAEAIIDVVKTKVGINIIEVRRDEEIVALFKGMVYRSSIEWK
jgi:acyl-CoA thioesterase